MHTGRTIEELIELVQHIHTHHGVRPRRSQDLAAPERNEHQRNEHQRNDRQHNAQHYAERLSSSGTPHGSPTTQPAWLAVFL
jgi:hypothetical protein